jgi:hypothetical protein
MSAESVPEERQGPGGLIAKSEWARRHGISRQYVTKLLKKGRIFEVNGKIDPVDADQRWLPTRKKIEGTGRYTAAAIRQRKDSQLSKENVWRAAILEHIAGKHHVVAADVVRDVIGIQSPTLEDRLRVANVLKGIGWRRTEVRLERRTRVVFASPDWEPQKPQRTPLAKAILDLRLHLCETQPQFSQRLQVSLGSASKYETNQIPTRSILKRLRDVALESGRLDLLALMVSERRPDVCANPDCLEERIAESRYCGPHRRARENEFRRCRLQNNPGAAEEIRKYRQANREKRNERRRRRRAEDEPFRNRLAYRKRAYSFKQNIERWCTEAYLRNAKEEDARTDRALRKWLKSFRKQRTSDEKRDEKLEYARRKSKDRYWRNPEKERRRVQAFQHSNPQYRERWNGARGAREAACSDGTLTREAVRRLFGASKHCPYCADPYKRSRRSLDHIIPLSKAEGRKLHSITNVLVCCRSCNTKKHAKGLTQFLGELKAAKRKGVPKSRPETAPGLFACHSTC